jgi:hypothetical protein
LMICISWVRKTTINAIAPITARTFFALTAMPSLGQY